MTNFSKNILITGGAGFIGSHVIRLFVKKYPDYRIINFDKLTYAGNLANLKDIDKAPNYVFVRGDIVSANDLESCFEQYQISDIIHLAAESHVDRSIDQPLDFVMTNVVGTVQLLQTARKYWDLNSPHIFHHVSTDEVYGSLGDEGLFSEHSPYDPHSPYSASKASSDHFVRAFYHTYQLPVKISNCSNNYGTHHYPEKLIPLTILNILNNKPVPIYGQGENVRDWLWVEDHARAIDCIFHDGKVGESYNVGGNNEWKNKDIVLLICRLMDKKLNRPYGTSKQLIEYVNDRAGHDFRYAINANKIKNELNWQSSLSFEEGIEKTIDWYIKKVHIEQKIFF